jgi:hypothetical protein
MYELLGALAFATLVAGYVLAVIFVRHQVDDGVGGQQSARPDVKKMTPNNDLRNSDLSIGPNRAH